MSEYVEPQPAPTPSGRPAVWDLVVEDMRARDRTGLARYGTRLQPHNGRDALVDLMEELLDAAVYCRQFQEEMKCLGRDLRGLRALLAESESPGPAGRARAVALLEAIFERNPVLRAE